MGGGATSRGVLLVAAERPIITTVPVPTLLGVVGKGGVVHVTVLGVRSMAGEVEGGEEGK